MGVSEARRLLPHIVRTIADEGGRVDVTVRGEPRVSIVRATDAATVAPSRSTRRGHDALRVEFAVPPGTLVEVVRALRARIGRPRELARGRRPRRVAT